MIGLAVAARFTSRFKEKTTYLVERHAQVGVASPSVDSLADVFSLLPAR